MYNPNLFAKLESGKGYDKIKRENVLNPYVNFYNYADTQSLQDTLIAESIQMRGVECFYLRREFVNLDLIFGEDVQSKFEKAYRIATYIKSYEGFEGQHEFFSKFGMQVNDELVFQVNPGLFKYQADGALPREGDLVYFPMGNTLFELTWVEPFVPFYHNGVNTTITMYATKFIYSGERLNPKVKEIIVPEPRDENHGLNFNELTSLDGLMEALPETTAFVDTDELTPVHMLNGLADTQLNQFEEDTVIKNEASKYVDPENYKPINGSGSPFVFNNSPFDDF